MDKKKVKEAFDEYMKNPSWEKYYESAPSEECKEYIRFGWYRSKFGEPKDVDEYIKLRDTVWDKLSVEDWEYIMEHVGNSPFRKVCKERIARLKEAR